MSDEIAGLYVHTVTNAYEAAAYWSSNSETDDRGGEPLDNYMTSHGTQPSAACLARMREDVETFLRACVAAGLDLSDCEAEQVGHDLWLTRNRHGVGFWDRDDKVYGTVERRDALDRLAVRMGEVNLWVDTERNLVEHD